ncbi:TraC-like protein [compost metagenome]
MKKPSSKIRDEIARLQEQLKAAETREAERIGRVALKAGLGEVEVDEAELQAAFEDLAKRFRGGKVGSTGKERAGAGSAASGQTAAVPPGAAQSSAGEA